MTVDIEGKELREKDRVICVESSIIMAPYCTDYRERPSRISKKKQEDILFDNTDSADDFLIKKFNVSVRNAKLWRDEIIGEKTVKNLNSSKKHVHMQWYTVKRVSGNHLEFYNVEGQAVTRHWHPASKFRKVEPKKTS